MHAYFDRRGRRRPVTPWVDRQPSKATIIAALILVPVALAATGDSGRAGISLATVVSWVSPALRLAATAAWWWLLGLGFIIAVTAAVLLAVAVVVWIAGLHLEEPAR